MVNWFSLAVEFPVDEENGRDWELPWPKIFSLKNQAG